MVQNNLKSCFDFCIFFVRTCEGAPGPDADLQCKCAFNFLKKCLFISAKSGIKSVCTLRKLADMLGLTERGKGVWGGTRRKGTI